MPETRGGGDGRVLALHRQTLLPHVAAGTCGDPARPSELIFLSAASFAAGGFSLIPLQVLGGAKPPQAAAIAAAGPLCSLQVVAGTVAVSQCHVAVVCSD